MHVQLLQQFLPQLSYLHVKICSKALKRRTMSGQYGTMGRCRQRTPTSQEAKEGGRRSEKNAVTRTPALFCQHDKEIVLGHPGCLQTLAISKFL
ncbi:hypothetical protein AVEN_4833-1 [Araneus ventricosus]|uniref:Uncharacterized protein n=1 Tax=Araneus ventricosus TaxID=182803 RepID=A0A4Y2PZR1_ARAVE|nr:hypothetical protein AVEN_4833-1 [Araneus ventricosus]